MLSGSRLCIRALMRAIEPHNLAIRRRSGYLLIFFGFSVREGRWYHASELKEGSNEGPQADRYRRPFCRWFSTSHQRI